MAAQSKHQESPKLGVKDFLDFVYDTQAEWSVLAVQAPIESVAAELAEMHDAASWLHEVPRREAGDEDTMGFPLIAIVQVKDNPWTVVYHELCTVSEAGLKVVTEEAEALSSKLDTRAISFVGEDTSGAVAYKLFEGGKIVEEAEWEDGGEFFTFKSKVRKQPDLETVDDEFTDEVFRAQGIYLPVCYPQADEEGAWLMVDKISATCVERADLLDMRGEEEEELEDEE
ncbi:MAG: hypothetical protein C5B50_11925 [Verrucomicrobia bacterium]|nr:MAG: hypothetical protein C5B50_11925 [Verrucomicrobiota bacterium]